MPTEAAPIVVTPSGKFLGYDGAWSTFVVAAGSPPQEVEVLMSTEVASSWVVSNHGCSIEDAANCTEARGGAYDFTESSTWNPKGVFLLGAEIDLGYTGPNNIVNGTYGYDTLVLPGSAGVANISVTHQVIASIITEEFYVGYLGLSNQPINVSVTDSSPSFMTSLKNQNLIPSNSYGYTAGATYQQKNGVNGSLTLGGYDASRFTPNDVSFTFAPTDTRQLVVAIPSITFSNSKTQTPLLSQPIMALIDSTVPHMWLPQEVCESFEIAFGISWDPIHNLYTVNDTTHSTLVKENPSVIFELANSDNGPSVNITLPYASFDLTATFPLVRNATRFFPLQRGSDDTAYTLGRTLLQEAYLIVDYDQSNFSISQAVFDPSTPSHIVAVLPTTASTAGPTNPSSSSSPIIKTTGNSSHGIGTGAIAGIAIAIILIASLIGAWFLTKRIRKPQNAKKARKLAEETEGDERKDAQEMSRDYLTKKDILSAGGPEAKPRAPIIEVKQVSLPMTPPSAPMSEMEAEMHGYFGDDCEKRQVPHEMPGSPVIRSELSSPELGAMSELPSPDPEALRSELSTPEPMYANSELPTPDPSHELSSPGLSPVSTPAPPRLVDNRQSAHSSQLQLPNQRPMSDRYDSSESEAGLTRDGMPRTAFYRRYNSDDSELPSLRSFSRPTAQRMDSEDSDSVLEFIHSNERHVETSASEAEIISAARQAVVARPIMINLDSSASESKGAVSSLPTIPSRTRAVQPTQSDSSEGEESSISSRPSATSRHVVGLPQNFYSSSVSRPAMRRSVARSPPQSVAPHQTTSNRFDDSDSDAWQTRLDSPSTEAASDMSRFNSVNHGQKQ